MTVRAKQVFWSGLWLSVWVAVIVLFLLTGTSDGETYAIGDSIPLVFELVDLATGQTVSGESPTVGLYKSNTGEWLDWSDNSWKSSGWVEQFTAMTELETQGRYLKSWDSSLQTPGNLVAIMSNAGPNYAEGTTSIKLKTYDICPDCPSLGSGSIPINHDYPEAGDQLAQDPEGAALPDVYIRVFSRADYEAGRVRAEYVQGLTYSDVNGEWEEVIFLDPGDYTTVFYKRGYRVTTYEFTVTAP